MSKTSAAVKNRYNAKAYDKIYIVVPKGEKERIKAFAAEKGLSTNALINQLLKDAMNAEKEG